jgi:hypothetical protein
MRYDRSIKTYQKDLDGNKINVKFIDARVLAIHHLLEEQTPTLTRIDLRIGTYKLLTFDTYVEYEGREFHIIGSDPYKRLTVYSLEENLHE